MFGFDFIEIKVSTNRKAHFNYPVWDYLDYCKEHDLEPYKEAMIEFFKERVLEDFSLTILDTDLELEIIES